jgi:bifunctional DNA-binding transcriptional regulator/antitoxin component of YhaV-PrlF toxin-antitoxin module
LRVSFLGRLEAGNRLTVPVEIRWRFRLEPGDLYYSVEVRGLGVS